jgi:hypothetical protein
MMYGEHDERFRKYAELVLRRLPHARRAAIRDAGHYLFTKEAAKTNEVLRSWFRHCEQQLEGKPHPYRAEAAPVMPLDADEAAEPVAGRET